MLRVLLIHPYEKLTQFIPFYLLFKVQNVGLRYCIAEFTSPLNNKLNRRMPDSLSERPLEYRRLPVTN